VYVPADSGQGQGRTWSNSIDALDCTLRHVFRQVPAVEVAMLDGSRRTYDATKLLAHRLDKAPNHEYGRGRLLIYRGLAVGWVLRDPAQGVVFNPVTTTTHPARR
jgi:hypothetical protein